MEAASETRRAPALDQFYEWLIATTRADPRPPRRVVDIGCGTGHLSVALRRAFPAARLTLCDPGREMIRRTRRRFAGAGHTDVVRTDAMALFERTPDESIDLAVFCRSWYTLDAHPSAARDVLRMLRPGGRCFVLDFSRRLDLRRLAAALRGLESIAARRCRAAARAFNEGVGAGFYRLHSRRSMRNLWRAAGGIVEACEAVQGGLNHRTAVRKPMDPPALTVASPGTGSLRRTFV